MIDYLMQSYTWEFIKYIIRLRDAKTSDTPSELELLSALAKDKKCIVEVGVYEGVASQYFCKVMNSNGKLYLVDPYFKDLKIEKVFNFSTSEFIAKQTVKEWKSQVKFIRLTSSQAASILPIKGKADLIFIDARHDYQSVLEDFNCWVPMLVDDGVIAFHDSRICEARPDLNDRIGPVRLCNEIARGKHGNWQVVNAVDSITVISRLKDGGL